MFTGIVQAVGEVAKREETSDGLRLTITRVPFLEDLDRGDSVAVAGVCLTVVDLDEEGFSVDAVAATLARTTVGRWREGDGVNLEPPLRAGDPLGGHIVQGHVDGVGQVSSAERNADSGTLEVALPPEIEEVTVSQGSLTIDGVSLTVNRLDAGVARFAIIPYTWSHTTLGRLTPGAPVNVEADVIGKYVGQAVRPYTTPARVEPGVPSNEPETETDSK